MPLNSSDYQLLIVSDLHLSEGRDEESRRLSRNEDFLFDEEFGRFLAYHVKSEPKRKWHLIINGDFCDFLQVIAANFDKGFYDYLQFATDNGCKPVHIPKQNTKYGLDAGPDETVWKLWKILNGHWMFTCALVKFIEAGNIVSIGPGNHDPEWAYPQVREHFHQLLGWFYLKKCGGADPKQFHQICCARVQFLDWFYYEPGQIWAEHGGQYDKLNCFPYGLAPFLPKKDEIEMPWGSFFVRYLFNSIEQQEPFADNIKPQNAFVQWLVTHHPLTALQFLYGNGRYMLKKMRRAWTVSSDQGSRKQEHLDKRNKLEREWKTPAGALLEVDNQRADSVFRETKDFTWKVMRVATLCWEASLVVATIVLAALLIGGISVVANVVAPVLPAALHLWLGSIASRYPGAIVQVFNVLQWLATFCLIAVLIALSDAIGKWIRSFSVPKKADLCYLVGKAGYASSQMKVKYVTMGHTHDTDLASVGDNAEYFNTGTWTKVFSPEEKLTRDESELVFLQGLRDSNGELTCYLMKWMDGAGEPRLVKLFSDEVGCWDKKTRPMGEPPAREQQDESARAHNA